MTIPPPLQEALRDSITSGTFVDTKFWVFSKRGSKLERVGKPKALFVNGHVAQRVPRLASLLDERGAKENLRARFPTDIKPYTSSYDYEDDSDLEDDYDDDDIPDEPESAPQVVTETPRNNDVIVLENSDAKSNESSDIISVSDLDSLFSESSDIKGETEPASSAHVGKVVVIEDVAFVTFQALLRYLYTDEIEFAPWGSAERRKARALENISESYGIPRPSPKSVYRLADKYDIPELKELALRQIQQDLSKCNITEEVFSEYTSCYPKLRELELKQLARVLLSSDFGPTLELLKAKIESYAHGEWRHAEHILPALYKLMESDESVKETPLPAVTSPSQQATGGDWEGLTKALTESLTSGTFLDSQFYAVQSRPSIGLPKILPIYFCSTVGGGFTSKLVAYSSKLRAGRALSPRCADDYDSDIDDEDPDPEGSVESYPRSKLIRENSTAANSPMEPALLLNSGAAKTWNAIFLYMYTGQITFTTLGSQGAVPSETEAQDGVEPCSPKSTYCLANKVGLTRLCDIAFNDIQSKLDENNIVQEFFSPFAANHARVRKMEHELFQSKLKSLVDVTLVTETIRSSSSGLNSYRTAAMELIIERSIRDRRERIARKAKNSSRPNPTPQPKRASEAPNISIQEVQAPAPAPKPPSQSSPSDTTGDTTFNSAPYPTQAKPKTSKDSSALSKPAKKVKKVERDEDPPENVKKNPPPSEKFVEQPCWECGAKKMRRSTAPCNRCSRQAEGLKCAGCKTFWRHETCTNCHRK